PRPTHTTSESPKSLLISLIAFSVPRNCPGLGNWRLTGSKCSDLCFWVPGKSQDDVPSLLFGGRDKGADNGEIHCPLQAAESAGDLLFDLHHAAIAFSLIVGEGDVGIVEEAEDVLLTAGEAQEKIVSGSTRLATAPVALRVSGGAQRRLGLMEGQPLGH